MRFHAPRALLGRAGESVRGVLDPECNGADRGAVHSRERLREASGLGVDDEVDLSLAIEEHILGAVLRDRREAHLLEQPAERGRVRRRVLDELEAVGAERVVPEGLVGAGHD